MYRLYQVSTGICRGKLTNSSYGDNKYRRMTLINWRRNSQQRTNSIEKYFTNYVV